MNPPAIPWSVAVDKILLTRSQVGITERSHITNQSREHTKRFDRKVDAQAWLDGITTEHGTGTYVDPARKAERFGTVAELWFNTKASRAPKTVADYRSLLDTLVLPRWADVKLADIHFEDVQTWVSALSKDGGHRFQGKGLSPARVIHAYQVLRYAIRAKRLAINPATDVELPRKKEPDKRFLSHQQVAGLAAGAGRFQTLVLVLAYCGLRFGEAVALRVASVDTDRGRLWVSASATTVAGRGIVEGPTKKHLSRSVPVPAFLLDELDTAVEGRSLDDLVFPSRHGGILPLGELRWQFDQAAEGIGLEGLVPHELRHTAASLAIAAGPT